MLKQRMFILPLIAWCMVVATTLLAFLFLNPSGDGPTRAFTFIWTGLLGFIVALLLGFVAARMARGKVGRSARLARALPAVMACVVLVALVLRMVTPLLDPW